MMSIPPSGAKQTMIGYWEMRIKYNFYVKSLRGKKTYFLLRDPKKKHFIFYIFQTNRAYRER